jgi:hypothetical protein
MAFSMCNKLFKPLCFPSRRVKSSEGLTIMLLTNIFHIHVIPKSEVSSKQWIFIHEQA